MLTLATVFAAGMFAAHAQLEINKPLNITENYINSPVRIEGSIHGNVRNYESAAYFTIRCSAIQADKNEYPVSGTAPCVVYGHYADLPEGALVNIRGTFKRIRRPIPRRGFIPASPFMNYTHRLVVDTSAPNSIIVKTGGSFFENMRNRLARMIDRYNFGGQADLLKAMILGERDTLSPATITSFARLGIAHIIAVSGLHVGIIALIVNFILNIFSIRKKNRMFITILLLFVYAGICGFRPPVTRAFIMISLVLGAFAAKRPKNIENSIFVALIAILALDPKALFGPSLQLSFAAVWGITTFHPMVMNTVKGKYCLSKYTAYFVNILIVSILACMATAPVIAAHFRTFSLLAVPVNLIAVPLAFLIISMGTAALVLMLGGYVTAPLAAFSAFLTGIFLWILTALADIVSRLPFASLETGHVSFMAVVGIAVWFFALSRFHRRDIFKKALVYIPLVVLLGYTWNPLVHAGRYDDKSGAVFFFDVGQGDAALVRYGNSRHFLVDTGPKYGAYDAGTSLIVPSLKNAGIRRLDGIFISHLHIDHTGGLNSILNNFPVDYIFCRQSIADSLSVLYGDRVAGISAGDSVAFTHGGILIMSPGAETTTVFSGKPLSENNLSLLLRFDMCGVRILFTGDVEKEMQRNLLKWETALKSNVLKVPHHGASGLREDFINLVHPLHAVISCGVRNRFGHPSEDTVATLEKSDCTIWRTDLDGTVQIWFPAFTVSTF